MMDRGPVTLPPAAPHTHLVLSKCGGKARRVASNPQLQWLPTWPWALRPNVISSKDVT